MNNSRSTVLACIDGSSLSEAVVDYASWVSHTVRNPLKLLHNIDSRHAPAPDLSGNIGLGAREALLEELTELEARRSRILLEQGRVMLNKARRRAVAQNAFEPSTLQRHGSLAESLIDLEEEIRVLVLGIRGEDHEDQQNRMGAQLETVIRSMHRPVLVVNRPFSQAPRRIMLATDGSESAGKALDMVATSPLYKGMHCHVVHVAKGDKHHSLEEAAHKLDAAGLNVTTAVLQGDVDAVLRDYQGAHEIDMTVMGAFGQNRLKELLFGSVTVKMLCSSSVPLLMLR